MRPCCLINLRIISFYNINFTTLGDNCKQQISIYKTKEFNIVVSIRRRLFDDMLFNCLTLSPVCTSPTKHF